LADYLSRVEARKIMKSEIGVGAQSEFLNGCATILLVEDETFVREVISRVLESVGYVVLQAEDAAGALNRFHQQEGAIDLLLTDLCMPGKSGHILAAELQAFRPEMKAIIMSGHIESEVEKECSQVTYLPKPFSMRALVRQVAEVLNRKGAHSTRELAIPAPPGRYA
jgi:two-component system, cell cycle sensor histidine kinase and response regulator CckA